MTREEFETLQVGDVIEWEANIGKTTEIVVGIHEVEEGEITWWKTTVLSVWRGKYKTGEEGLLGIDNYDFFTIIARGAE